MVKIEVNADVARRIIESGESIEIVDERGRRLGFVSRPISDNEIAEARRRADTEEGGSTLDDVWNRIKSKHGGEWHRGLSYGLSLRRRNWRPSGWPLDAAKR